MLFNSFTFLCLFLPTVLFLFAVFPQKFRMALLTFASFVFYFWGESRIEILFYFILINYFGGLLLSSLKHLTRPLLASGICLNLLPLIVFKYLGLFGLETSLVLPLGISFFAFQGISYLVDVSRLAYAPQKNLLKYSFFKSFFGPLVAGPILRYSNIVDILDKPLETPADGLEGLKRFIRGLAKKVIIADSLAQFADLGFQNVRDLSSLTAWLVLVAFTLQIYFDFSGYSDMAIGLGYYFGIPIPENFDRPLRSNSITQFWRHWHMTLTRWFRDYLYIPLGGNRVSKSRHYFNLFTVFILCGLWHGGTWLFALWGLFHGSLLVFEAVLKVGATPGFLKKYFGTAYVFLMVSFSWIFFRAPNLGEAKWWLLKVSGLSPAVAVTRSSVELYSFMNPYFVCLFAGTLVSVLVPSIKFSRISSRSWFLHFILYAVCLLYLMGRTRHPFIYFLF